jgi:hypothetical protein
VTKEGKGGTCNPNQAPTKVILPSQLVDVRNGRMVAVSGSEDLTKIRFLWNSVTTVCRHPEICPTTILCIIRSSL